MTENRQAAVGVIGLGSMGIGIAGTLAGKGFPTYGFDIAAQRRQLAQEAGVIATPSLREALEAGDHLVFSLPTAADVAAVVNDHIELLAGKADAGTVIIDTSTSEPAVSRALAARLEALGIGFLDAPVSGGPAGAASGRLTMMIGGSEAHLSSARPVIDALAATALHVGPSGAGNVAKLVNNLLAAAHLVTTGEGLKLALAAGIDPEAALHVVNSASGRSMISEVHFPTWITSDRFDSGFTMGLMRKDVRLAMELAQQSGADLPLSRHVAALWADGDGLQDADDFTRMGAFRKS